MSFSCSFFGGVVAGVVLVGVVFVEPESLLLLLFFEVTELLEVVGVCFSSSLASALRASGRDEVDTSAGFIFFPSKLV